MRVTDQSYHLISLRDRSNARCGSLRTYKGELKPYGGMPTCVFSSSLIMRDMKSLHSTHVPGGRSARVTGRRTALGGPHASAVVRGARFAFFNVKP
eukprot:4975238-Prymnesium_polylepis.1